MKGTDEWQLFQRSPPVYSACAVDQPDGTPTPCEAPLHSFRSGNIRKDRQTGDKRAKNKSHGTRVAGGGFNDAGALDVRAHAR